MMHLHGMSHELMMHLHGISDRCSGGARGHGGGRHVTMLVMKAQGGKGQQQKEQGGEGG